MRSMCVGVAETGQALRRARNLFDGVFFLIAFSFAPASSKEKAGINTYAEHVCWRRRDRGWSMYLLFWLLTELKLLFFTQSNFPFIALFTDKKRGKSHIRGVPPLIYLPPCRLAATSANKVPRPSDCSITTATGSKR